LKPPVGQNFDAKEMWKFAIECVVRSLRAKRGALNAFTIPATQLTAIEVSFKPMLLQYLQAKKPKAGYERDDLITR
jgi:hypothetical protein